MLNREEAGRQLEALREESWLDDRRAAAGRLPGAARKAANWLLGEEAETEDLADLDEAPSNPLTELSEHDRRALFGALFPLMSDHVERAWQLIGRLPYRVGYTSGSYRAPNEPGVYAPARLQWFNFLLLGTQGYTPQVTWLAAWAPHLATLWAADTFGVLFAAAIDGGGPDGDAVWDILRQSAAGGHEIGGMGEHVIRAFLSCSRPEAWDEMVRMLLAAQREEGLRQSILERADEAQLGAFRRLLRVILDENLVRFSAVVRAVDTWFGFGYEALAARDVEQALTIALRYLDSESDRLAALDGDDANACYLALWSAAVHDAVAAVPLAARLLADPLVDKRYAAARALVRFGLRSAVDALTPALRDEDLRVACAAVSALNDVTEELAGSGLFEDYEALLARLPKKKTTAPALVYPWWEQELNPSVVAYGMMEALGKRPFQRLLPYASSLEPSLRGNLVRRARKVDRSQPAIRGFLLDMVGDASPDVRQAAQELLKGTQVQAAEAPGLEALLSRKSADLRRAVMPLLMEQADAEALASADRLTASRDSLQRLAGLELLRELAKAKRAAADCRRRAAAYREAHPKVSVDEQGHLDALAPAAEAAPPGPQRALGLVDPARLTPAVALRRHKVDMETSAAAAILVALDALIQQHGATTTHVEGYAGPEERPLAEALAWWTVRVERKPADGCEPAALPLADIWLDWWHTRDRALRDADSLELCRAWWMVEALEQDPRPGFARTHDAQVKVGRRRPVTTSYQAQMATVLGWLMLLEGPAGATGLLLDAAETACAELPASAFQPHRTQWGYVEPPTLGGSANGLGLVRLHRTLRAADWHPAHHARLWGLVGWVYEPRPAGVAERAAGVAMRFLERMLDDSEVPAEVLASVRRRLRPPLDDVLHCLRAGVINADDVIEHLVGDIADQPALGDLGTLSGRKPPPAAEDLPELPAILDRIRDRVLGIELSRGDTPSAATPAARALQSVHGAGAMVRLLQSVGKDGFRRATWGDDSKGGVLSHLLRVCWPDPDDTPEHAAELLRAARLPDQAVCDAALVAPQWAAHLQTALGWDGFEDGVWWLYAHTKDDRWGVESDIRETWGARVTEYTPLTGQELLDGAVDVAWFGRAYAALGEERWKRLYAAAKFGSSGTGHGRAQLFADAMLGQVTVEELVARSTGKRNQDALRALGLAPLADEAGLLGRYEVVQEFVRTSKQFGSQRQESEKRAAAIALDNLARTAGFPDPIRLQWAMEARAVADLREGPVTAAVGETVVALSIVDGRPEITVTKAGKPLKSVPPAIAKDPAVKALRERKTALERQASRMRQALEQAMCRGDRFTGRELGDLLEHPLLAPSLERLVWAGDGSLGYPAEGGHALRDHQGALQPLGREEPVHLAHAHDLLVSGEWHAWQRECFAAQRVQPFKQVFRELYPLTEAERADGDRSCRYAGHQVQPRQTLALLGGRGWVHDPEEGVRKTLHEAGLSAWIDFDLGFWTPAEVEGLTIEAVRFTRRGDWRAVALADVPPVVFSEVMRDLDLVVSVAHRGGVDPEATASSMELRGALLRETCALLGLANVTVEERQTAIAGHFALYTVHLGSAVVHRQPGGMVCIVPVHSQHRGRLFLPFADDDPKTAEVVAKVLLLARDDEIKDPTILEQVR